MLDIDLVRSALHIMLHGAFTGVRRGYTLWLCPDGKLKIAKERVKEAKPLYTAKLWTFKQVIVSDYFSEAELENYREGFVDGRYPSWYTLSTHLKRCYPGRYLSYRCNIHHQLEQEIDRRVAEALDGILKEVGA